MSKPENFKAEPKGSSRFAPAHGSAAMAELLASMGLGPRECADCGKTFSVPPYADCKEWKYCSECASLRFWEWVQTPDGQKTMEAFKQPNDQAERLT